MQGLGRRVADFARQSQAVREARGRIGNSRNVVGIAVEAQAQVGEADRWLWTRTRKATNLGQEATYNVYSIV